MLLVNQAIWCKSTRPTKVMLAFKANHIMTSFIYFLNNCLALRAVMSFDWWCPRDNHSLFILRTRLSFMPKWLTPITYFIVAVFTFLLPASITLLQYNFAIHWWAVLTVRWLHQVSVFYQLDILMKLIFFHYPLYLDSIKQSFAFIAWTFEYY